ncbi:response regulator [Cohnella massiliensis]|uniref:response regulator n=1 Tax=Cohnella massiliensis TaxID=1816691 RepID=UPI0009BC2D76|nr:response regulator [Cohnella massiliensis]
MKRKLLIADDERNIRVGLRAMIERKFPGRYEFAFAENGDEALALLAGDRFELLLTDIRMPVMDGIELLEQMQALEAKPEVVILSGYDDFPYAKAAIRYQAKEYLLKPIVREELFAVLERLEDELRRKGEKRADDTLRRTREVSDQLAYVLLQESADEREIRERLTRAGLGWLDGEYAIALVKAAGGETDRQAMLEGLDRLLEGEAEWGRCQDREGLTAVVARDSAILAKLPEALAAFSPNRPRVGLSSRVSGMGRLRLAYSQARQALKYYVLHAEGGVVAYDRVRALASGCPVPEDAIRKISNLMGTGRLPEMKRLLQQALDIRAISRCEIGLLETIGRKLNEEVFDRVYRSYGEESIEILKLYKNAGHFDHFDSFHDYYRHVEQLTERLDEYVSRVRAAHAERKDMQKAVEYIHEHYRQDVNMAVVSNYVSLNYTYFSQAFKEHTGESFSSYLRKVRLAKAKELLEGTDLKVYEISSQAGFESVKHFTRLFKEAEGVSPLEYRSARRIEKRE